MVTKRFSIGIGMVAGVIALALVPSIASADTVWEGKTLTDVGGYYGNTVTVNGAGNLVVGVGASNGWSGSLDGTAGYFFQGRANWTPDASAQKVSATFLMPESNAVNDAYDSWISMRVLRYPAGIEHSGDAGFFFANAAGDGDMYYANTRIVPAPGENPEFVLPRPAAGTSQTISIERNANGTLTYSLNGNVFHTSSVAGLFPDLGTVQIGGGYFVAGGTSTSVPNSFFEFTDVSAVTPTPVAATAGLVLMGLTAMKRRRA